jgi:hypothetical protein
VNRTPLARSRCGTRRYRDLATAERAMAKRRDTWPPTAYECTRCGGAHIKTSPKPRVAGRRRDTGPSRAVRDVVLARDGHACVCCGRDISAGMYSLQHRRARGAGGSAREDTNRPANLVTLCGHATSPDGCHARVESQPTWAHVRGYRVDQGRDPAAAPLWWHGELVLLAHDGTVWLVEPTTEVPQILQRYNA